MCYCYSILICVQILQQMSSWCITGLYDVVLYITSIASVETTDQHGVLVAIIFFNNPSIIGLLMISF